MLAAAEAPPFDWAALAPFIALTAGMVAALLLGLLPRRAGRLLAMLAGIAGAAVAAVLAGLRWDEPIATELIAESLVLDRAAIAAIVICSLSAITGIVLAARARGTRDAGHGETTGLILASVLGMAILAAAADLVTVFLGLELLSIPLYVLCASHVDRTASLESGLKYLILGSVGSATALMGLVLLYGATGEMQLSRIAAEAGDAELSGLIVPGLALVIAGFGFKLSLAPLHQWTPDVYDGAPTAITAFMSVATKTAALIVTARILTLALDAQFDLWNPMLMVLAAASIIVGNVGALGQPGMKRLLGYSSVAQAGYLVAALSVGAIGAMLAYLVAYAVCTLAVFAVVSIRESGRTELSDDVSALEGLGGERPLLGWIATLGLFGLAGLPLTAGFFGKIAVVGALVTAGEHWLAVVLIVGSIISLAYYVPPVLRIWRRPAPDPAAAGTPATAAVATAAPVVTPRPRLEVVVLAVVLALLVLAGGVWPQPLFDLAGDAAGSFFAGR